jgi:hypothetical protein
MAEECPAEKGEKEAQRNRERKTQPEYERGHQGAEW